VNLPLVEVAEAALGVTPSEEVRPVVVSVDVDPRPVPMV
jgi:hypothetical protein